MESDGIEVLEGGDGTDVEGMQANVSPHSSETDGASQDTQTQTRDTTVSVETVQLTDAQYAELTGFMSTQLYVCLAIFAAAALTFGAVVAQQVLSHWRV